ncbi:condensation domain-containing protein [Nocardia sp. NPDC020380]|uniref:condensation domain-containing protein n=1 Tax=Nocardia sp. NPDC020380 TaxID=3364309 RepID=UPI0037BB5BBE
MNSPASNLALERLRAKRDAGATAYGIPVRTGTGSFPATPAQRGIRLHEQLANNAAVYHVPLGLRLTGALDANALREAAVAVAAHQHALRTVFGEDAQGLSARVRDDLGIDWRTEDLRLLPDGARADAADELLSAFATATFDLTSGPPVRWLLLRLADTDWILAVNAHHLVLDGVSIPLLIDQLWAAYGARTGGLPPAPPQRQYADYAEWLQRQAPRAAAIQRRARLLDGTPPLDVSIGLPRPHRVTNDGTRIHQPISPELSAAIREAAAAQGVPTFVWLLACYQVALAAHTGQDDFAIGIPMAARPHDELSGTVGHFVNTVPVRSDVAAWQAFTDLLRLVRDSALSAYEDETVPFESVVEQIGGPWDPRFSPVFQVLFVQQRLHRPDLGRFGLSVEWHSIDTGATLYDLVLHVAEADAELVCELTYNTALLDRAAAHALTRDFLAIVAASTNDPGIAVAELLSERRHLAVAVAGPDAEEITRGLAAALHRGGIPARVTAETRTEAAQSSIDIQGRIDLLVTTAGFDGGDAESTSSPAGPYVPVGATLLTVVPTGYVPDQALSTRAVVTEVDPQANEDAYGLGWQLGRTLSSWTRDTAPAQATEPVLDRLARPSTTPIPAVPDRTAARTEMPSTVAEFEAPAGPLEIRLAELWAQALGVPAVGRHDDFFLLGGTSLAATRLLSQLLDEFGVAVSLRELFERPTLARAAQLLESAATDENSLRPADRVANDLLPVSYAQERLWFLENLDPGNSTYIMPGGLRLHGSIDAGALQAALGRVEQRHEVLRTVYLTTDEGELRQQVRPYTPRPLPVTDLTEHSPTERESAENSITAAVSGAPFDLAAGPLWRYHLIATGPDEHLLLIALHHIVCDGWSIAVLSQEISAHYQAELAAKTSESSGATAELPPLTVQYADYAIWQRDNAARLDDQLEHWRTALADAPVTEIPGDRPRPARRTSHGAVERATVDPDVLAAVRKIAADQGVTVFAVLLATFYVVLHRHIRQRDLVVASPIAGRTRAATEPLIGCFLNTLALRVELDPKQPFTDLTADVGRILLSAYANQDCPFERVISAVAPDRDLSRTPVAQIMFNYLNTPPPVLDMAGLHAELVDAPRRTAKLDLDLTVDETGDEPRLSLEYSTDLYDADTAHRLLRHYAGALASVAARPDSALHELSLGDPLERDASTGWELPGTPATPEAESGETLGERLAQVAVARGHATALSNDEHSITYAELDMLAEDTARLLLRTGVAGGRVGLLYRHTPESFVAVWAALRAGVTYVPLDPRAPLDRLLTIVEEAKIAALLCDPSLVDTARKIAGPARILPVCDQPGEAHFRPVPVDHLIPASIAGGPAYITYTSGSTGRPKGVAQSSESALAHAVRYARRLRIGPGDVVAAPARYTFDAGILNSFGAAVAGAELHVIDPHLFGPAALRTELDSAGVTVLHCTPTLFRYLLSDTEEPWLPSKIRVVGLGGEQVVRGDVLDFQRHFGPDCRLVSLYGPTECSVALQHAVTAADADRAGVPIGRPVAGVEAGLIDENGFPTEVFGELVLHSPHVALGYWERAELTGKVFGTDHEGPFYRTGDLARRLTDGRLVYAGRVDRQVKIRGHRVEPGEAETVLRAHPTVGEAAVVLDPSAHEPRLVAYVTQDGPLRPDADELTAFMRTRLPDYMIPSALAVLAELPRGLTGKLDERRLPRILPVAEPAWTPPRTELERVVAEVWAQVLEREVGLGQNFFDLGGHSLALARARGLLERRLGVQLAMTDLFAAPTVEDLARLLEGRTAPAADADRGLQRRAAAARTRHRAGARETEERIR